MKVAITGAAGQLGRALHRSAPDGVEVELWPHARLDISDYGKTQQLMREAAPDVIINAAAYTAVDRAENAPEAAFAVNATGVENLAHAASTVGARLVQISTDYVFDGASGAPYATDAPAAPLNIYGRTKLAGEKAAGAEALIVRTSWVYAPNGNNFVCTLLRLLGELGQVRIVADQIGSPTYAPALAAAIWGLVDRGAQGTFHVTDNGIASWYDFAVAIQEEALALGLLKATAAIIPISTEDYPAAARRPACCVLDKTQTWRTLDTIGAHWRSNLRLMLGEAARNG